MNELWYIQETEYYTIVKGMRKIFIQLWNDLQIILSEKRKVQNMYGVCYLLRKKDICGCVYRQK